MLRPMLFENNLPTFDNFFQDFFSERFQTLRSMQTDIIDQGDSYLIQAELPGFKKEDIQLEIHNDRLSITASHKEEKEDRSDNYIRRERNYSSYARSFYVGDVDSKLIEASYENGILEVKLPKNESLPNSTKRIEVK